MSTCTLINLAVPFFTASSGSLIQVLNRTIPQKLLNLRFSAVCHNYHTIPPGTSFVKWYHLDEGDVCYTNGERVYNDDDGYDWVQLEDGGWVAAHLLGI